jgi:hypothetical protein
LTAPATAGSSSINVADTIAGDWKVGDEIVVGPTERIPDAYEVFKINAIQGKVITLNTTIKNYHYGAAAATTVGSYGSIDQRAEVAQITRNINIEGSRQDGWGGRVYTGQIYDTINKIMYRGTTKLDGVQLTYTGQANTSQAGLAFEKLTYDGPESVVTNCVVRESEGWNVLLDTVTNVRLERNVFFFSKRTSVKTQGKMNNLIFRDNLILAALNRNLNTHAQASVDVTTAAYFEGTLSNFKNCMISGNIVSGANSHAYIMPGGDCSSDKTGPYQF